MTTPIDPPAPPTTAAGSPAVVTSWRAQWTRVPAKWRRPVYRIYTAPFDEVFLRNQSYLALNPPTPPPGPHPQRPNPPPTPASLPRYVNGCEPNNSAM